MFDVAEAVDSGLPLPNAGTVGSGKLPGNPNVGESCEAAVTWDEFVATVKGGEGSAPEGDCAADSCVTS